MTETQPRPFRRWAKRLAFVNLVCVAAVTVWFYLAADEHWLATLLLFGPRWLAFAPLALLLPFALLTRSAWGLLWCVSAAVIIVWPFMGVVVNLSAIPGTMDAAPIRLATFNADNKDCDRAQFHAFVKEFNLDAIALEDADRIREPDLPTGYQLVVAANGIKLASKYPIIFLGDLSDPVIGPARGAAKFRVAFPKGEREICVVHLPTPRPGLEAILARKPNAIETLEKIITQRNEGSAIARKWLGDASLVMGDFNMPPESVIYRRDWSGFRNAFDAWGQGYGWTMNSKRGAVRIDHILFTDQWHCRGVVVGPDLGSAHRPVIADFNP